MVVLLRPEMLALRAFPGVEVVVVGEAGSPEALRAVMRVAREHVEEGGCADQEEGVRTENENLSVHAQAPGSRTPTGSVISVKRTSGCSRATRGTVWRMPSQVM